jgi:hypothetical protein
MSNPYRDCLVELYAWAKCTSSHYYRTADVLDRTRILLAQSEPAELTDGELDEMERRYWKLDSSIEIEPEGISEVWDRKETFDHRAFARAAISAACARARFDHPTPQPVAVSELADLGEREQA